MSAPPPACEHDASPRAEATADACRECGAQEQLRVCNACGHVGCAQTQQGHAEAHASAAGHPVQREHAPPDDDGWTWCATCDDYVA